MFRADLIPVTRVVAAPAEKIWAVLSESFADLGFPSSASASTPERVYLTPSLRIKGRLYPGEMNSVYLDCGHGVGGGKAADSYEVTFAMMVRLIPQDTARTMVQVLIDGTARDRTIQTSNAMFCAGTGRLEADLFKRLEAHLGLTSPSR